jgi:hypothetical protein
MAATGATREIKKSEIISCSRRTDVPAFNMPWVLAQIVAGQVAVANPRNPSQVTRVSLAKEDVRCWAWWSKDYAEWIRAYEDEATSHLLRQYDAHIFNFTINDKGNGHSVLEPGLRTSLEQRLEQLTWLVAHFGAASIVLRFDPIVHYRMYKCIEVHSSEPREPFGTAYTRIVHTPISSFNPDGSVMEANPDFSPSGCDGNNLGDFARIVRHASSLGITFVVVAFAIPFANVTRRLRSYRTADDSRIELIDISSERRRAIITAMRDYLRPLRMRIKMCCSGNVTADIEDVGPSACIDATQVATQVAAQSADTGTSKKKLRVRAKDQGQRATCNCVKSTDIAGYGVDFACPHACVYCYANPKTQ